MRTRRSWKNQNRLFKELFAPKEQPKPKPIIRTDEEIDAMYWMPKQSRRMMKLEAAKMRQYAVKP